MEKIPRLISMFALEWTLYPTVLLFHVESLEDIHVKFQFVVCKPIPRLFSNLVSAAIPASPRNSAKIPGGVGFNQQCLKLQKVFFFVRYYHDSTEIMALICFDVKARGFLKPGCSIDPILGPKPKPSIASGVIKHMAVEKITQKTWKFKVYKCEHDL